MTRGGRREERWLRGASGAALAGAARAARTASAPRAAALATVAFVAALVATALARAGEEPREAGAPPPRRLLVATKHAPPFSMRAPDGSWTGLSIELWRDMATELGLDYELREMDLASMLRALRDGSADAAVAALSVTAEREAVFDFTHPFHTAGIGIAVRVREEATLLPSARALLSWEFAALVGGALALMLAVGTLVWALERRRNPADFPGAAGPGIGAGLWWAAVTASTVGYGDKVPRTVAGRAVAIVWMFAGVVGISSFTAAVASILAVKHLEGAIRGPEDLPRASIAAVKDTASETYLRAQGLRAFPYPTAEAALEAVARGERDAAVYDAPILRWLATHSFQGRIVVLPQVLVREDYGIGLPRGSELRKPLNRVLLERLKTQEWLAIRTRYLGS